VLEIDGSQYSGSGAIVRQAVAFAALTGTAIHIYNVRFKRPKPGLRLQHAQAVEAIRQLVNGTTEGAVQGTGIYFLSRQANRKPEIFMGYRLGWINHGTCTGGATGVGI